MLLGRLTQNNTFTMDKKFTIQVKQNLPDKLEDPEMSAGLAEALGCYVMQMVIAILSISFYYIAFVGSV